MGEQERLAGIVWVTRFANICATGKRIRGKDGSLLRSGEGVAIGKGRRYEIANIGFDQGKERKGGTLGQEIIVVDG